jgi:hypothetical protein
MWGCLRDPWSRRKDLTT